MIRLTFIVQFEFFLLYPHKVEFQASSLHVKSLDLVSYFTDVVANEILTIDISNVNKS